MSPEQVQGHAIDLRSDLYSVGITLYEMVTGEKPITGDTSWAIMSAHVTQIPRAPAAVNPNLSPALSLAILKAIEKRPEDRYQNATEFAEVLNVIRTRLAPAKAAEPGPQIPASRPHLLAATPPSNPQDANAFPLQALGTHPLPLTLRQA